MRKVIDFLKKTNLKQLLWGAAFVLAYSQAQLFTSNQNQYFLHGLAKAGWGYLENDWLVNTKDPTPVFSFLIETAYRIFQTELIFHFLYAAALCVYFYCIVGIVSHLTGFEKGLKQDLLIFTLLLMHSEAARYVLSAGIGVEWKFVLEGGLAGQRILGEVLQPSSAGILLFVSIYLFLKKKRIIAVLLLPLTATIHPTYLLSAGLLTAAYMLISWLEDKDFAAVIKIGSLALTAVLPILLYSITVFTATSPEIYERTRERIVNFRIPHHAVPAEWFNGSSAAGLALILLAIWLLRRSKYVWLPAIPFAAGLGLSILQILTGNHSLALIFPWRLSAFLIPLSSSLAVGYFIQWIVNKWPAVFESRKTLIMSLLWIITACAALFGVYGFYQTWEMKQYSPEAEMMAWAKSHASADQIYLIPTKVQDFRLETGIPIFVDFKSIPYQDFEVREWLGRVYDTGDFYRAASKQDPISCSLLNDFHSIFGVSHIVLPAELGFLDCDGLNTVYADSFYQIQQFLDQ